MKFHRGQEVRVIDNHGEEQYEAKVAWTYGDGSTVAVQKIGARFASTMPARFVVPKHHVHIIHHHHHPEA